MVSGLIVDEITPVIQLIETELPVSFFHDLYEPQNIITSMSRDVGVVLVGQTSYYYPRMTCFAFNQAGNSFYDVNLKRSKEFDLSMLRDVSIFAWFNSYGNRNHGWSFFFKSEYDALIAKMKYF